MPGESFRNSILSRVSVMCYAAPGNFYTLFKTVYSKKMKNQLLADANTAKQTFELIEKFFDGNEADEINDVLGVLLENYIRHAPVERSSLSEAAYICTRLQKLFYSLERLQRNREDSKVDAIHVEDDKKCIHN